MADKPNHLTRDDWFAFIEILARLAGMAAGLLKEYVKERAQEVKR